MKMNSYLAYLSMYDESISDNRTRFRAKEIEILTFSLIVYFYTFKYENSLSAVSLITSFPTKQDDLN